MLLITVVRLMVDRAEQFEDARLLSPTDGLFQSLGHGSFLRSMPANLSSLFDEPIIYCKVSCHVFNVIDVLA